MIQVACAIIFQNGGVLITQRGQNKSHPGLWEFPGGKLEPDESPEACIVRELQEELDISIRVIVRLKTFDHDYDTFRIRLFPFIAKIVSGNIQLTEHMNFAWAKPGELKSFNWVQADLKLLDDVLEIMK